MKMEIEIEMIHAQLEYALQVKLKTKVTKRKVDVSSQVHFGFCKK